MLCCVTWFLSYHPVIFRQTTVFPFKSLIYHINFRFLFFLIEVLCAAVNL